MKIERQPGILYTGPKPEHVPGEFFQKTSLVRGEMTTTTTDGIHFWAGLVDPIASKDGKFKQIASILPGGNLDPYAVVSSSRFALGLVLFHPSREAFRDLRLAVRINGNPLFSEEVMSSGQMMHEEILQVPADANPNPHGTDHPQQQMLTLDSGIIITKTQDIFTPTLGFSNGAGEDVEIITCRELPGNDLISTGALRFRVLPFSPN